MYNEQTLKKALEKFDWPAALAHLPDHGEESLKKLFTDLSRTGILIRVFALPPAVEQKRKEFIEELTAFVEGTTAAPAAACEATDRAHRSGTWGNVDYGKSCTRWPDVRSQRTRRDDRLGQRYGSAGWHRAPCVAARSMKRCIVAGICRQ
jgi:hypothetical protein